MLKFSHRVTASNDLQLRGLQKGREVEPGAGEEAVEKAVAVLHAPEPGLDQRGQLAEAAFYQVGQGSLNSAQTD
jgi:hypothetical protein